MSLWDPPKIVRIYEATSKEAAMHMAAREAHRMAQQGFEITGGRWSPPQVPPEKEKRAIRRAVAAIRRLLVRRSLVVRPTGSLVVTWTQTAERSTQG
jgi:hypothetical protein